MLGMRLALVIPVQLGTKSERNQFLTNYTIAGLLIMLSAIFLLGLDRGSWPLALPQQGVYFVEANVLFPIGAYYFLYGLIIEQTFIRRALSHPFMVLLGKSSYAFFLVHTGIVAVFIQRQISRDLSLLLISLYGLSILIYFILERPLNQWFNRLFSSSTTHRRSMGQ
jgi:peptidoglycan/LPS O-acetylase OafA/YrhL